MVLLSPLSTHQYCQGREKTQNTDLSNVRSLCSPTAHRWVAFFQGDGPPLRRGCPQGWVVGVPVTPGHLARSRESEPSLSFFPGTCSSPQVMMMLSAARAGEGDGMTKAYGSAPGPSVCGETAALQSYVFPHTRAARPRLCVTSIPCFLCLSGLLPTFLGPESLNSPQRLNAAAHIVCQAIRGHPPP